MNILQNEEFEIRLGVDGFRTRIIIEQEMTKSLCIDLVQ